MKNIHEPSKKDVREGLAEGLYLIMRKTKSYRLEHFFGDKRSNTYPIYAAQFFGLLRLIDREHKLEKKAIKDSKKKSKKKR